MPPQLETAGSATPNAQVRRRISIDVEGMQMTSVAMLDEAKFEQITAAKIED
jgi:hypothetical protein